MAPPFKVAEFDLLYGKGISKSGELIDIGVELDIVEKSGSWFSFDGVRLGQGKDNARKFIEENPEYLEKIEQRIKQQGDKLDLTMTSSVWRGFLLMMKPSLTISIFRLQMKNDAKN